MDLSQQFLKLLVHFRRQDLVTFADDHARFYAEAQSSDEYEYGKCIAHYYSVMSKVIDEYFSGSFHLVPPLQKCHASLPASIKLLHARIGEWLELGPGKHCVDIGCGIGRVIEDLAPSGAHFTGLTIASNEVQKGNAHFGVLGIQNKCKLVEADCTKDLHLASESQDAAYAIYALKYLPKLGPTMRELARVLKPNGLLLVYDLIKTDKFDAANKEHCKLLDELQFACGMPPIHSRAEMVREAERVGFALVRSENLAEETGLPFHHCFSRSPLFMWMIRSPTIGHLIKLAQTLGILPPGFHRFNKVFLSGTVEKIVRAGQMGILSGSEMLLFKKCAGKEGNDVSTAAESG